MSNCAYSQQLFRELTYLQFCMMPELFEQYLQILVKNSNYKTISDIFIMYGQTLLEITNYTTSPTQMNIALPFNASSMSAQLKFISQIDSHSSNLKNNQIGRSLINLLTMVLAVTPLGREHTLYAHGVSIALCSHIAQKLLKYAQENDLQKTDRIIDRYLRNKFKQQDGNDKLIYSYYETLGVYYELLALQDEIKSGRKVSNIISIQTQLKKKVQNFKSIFMSKKTPNNNNKHVQIEQYIKKFEKLSEKLLYTLKPLPKSQQISLNIKNNKIQRQTNNEIGQIDSVFDIQQKIQSMHINSLYLSCVPQVDESINKQRILMIKAMYQNEIKNKHNHTHKHNNTNKYFNFNRIGYESIMLQIQTLCLLYLQEVKQHSITYKLDVYMILLAIKVHKNNRNINDTQYDKFIHEIFTQLKMLLSFQQVPQLQYTMLFVCQLIAIQLNSQEINNSQIQLILDTILKAHQKQKISSNIDNNNNIVLKHGSRQQYIRVALLSSLYLNHHSTLIKVTNAKIQLQRLCDNMDVIQYINNKNIIDYLIELVLLSWDSKHMYMRIFNKQNDNVNTDTDKQEQNKKRNKTNNMQQEIQRQQPLSVQNILNIKQAIDMLKQTMSNKLTLVQQNNNNNNNNSTNDHLSLLQINNKKIDMMLSILIRKRQNLTKQSSHEQYFHNRTLSLIFLMFSNSQIYNENQQQNNDIHIHKYALLIQQVLTSLQQLNLISLYHVIPQRTGRVFMLLLYICLTILKNISNDNKTNITRNMYMKQALIVMLLVMHNSATNSTIKNYKIQWNKIQELIKQNMQHFNMIKPQLFKCINNYEVVQMLVDMYRHVYLDVNKPRYQQSSNDWLADSQNYLYNWPDNRRDKVLLSKRTRFTNYLISLNIKQKIMNISNNGINNADTSTIGIMIDQYDNS